MLNQGTAREVEAKANVKLIGLPCEGPDGLACYAVAWRNVSFPAVLLMSGLAQHRDWRPVANGTSVVRSERSVP